MQCGFLLYVIINLLLGTEFWIFDVTIRNEFEN